MKPCQFSACIKTYWCDKNLTATCFLEMSASMDSNITRKNFLIFQSIKILHPKQTFLPLKIKSEFDQLLMNRNLFSVSLHHFSSPKTWSNFLIPFFITIFWILFVSWLHLFCKLRRGNCKTMIQSIINILSEVKKPKYNCLNWYNPTQSLNSDWKSQHWCEIHPKSSYWCLIWEVLFCGWDFPW